MKNAIAISALLCLSACGGGSGSSSIIDTIIPPAAAGLQPAQPTAINILQFPTAQTGSVYSEAHEMFSALPLTTGQSSTTNQPFVFGSVYAVVVPSLQPTDVVTCTVQAEITNNLGYNVQVDRMFGSSITNEAWPAQIGPNRGENLTPDMHHMTIDQTLIDTGRSGTVTYTYNLSAASTAALQGDAITVEQGYGGLTCHVTPN